MMGSEIEQTRAAENRSPGAGEAGRLTAGDLVPITRPLAH